MYQEMAVRGIVLSASLLKEYDKRLVILTEQMGKVTVFANGARRQNSRFTAVAQSFTMGRFQLHPGRQAYTLVSAERERSFLELSQDMEAYASASYCAELVDYFTREGVGGRDELNLLYLAFVTLGEHRLSPAAVRAAFAVKLLDIEGEMRYPEHPAVAQYILSQPINRTFSFQLSENSERELVRLAEKELDRVLDYPLRSEEILRSLASM